MTTPIEALRVLHAIIHKLHYGRMPTEVEAAMENARAALAQAQPAAEPLSKKGGGVMSDDLIQRLRNAAITGLDPSPFDTLTHEAANEIERLRFDREHLSAVHAQDQEEIKRLRSAQAYTRNRVSAQGG